MFKLVVITVFISWFITYLCNKYIKYSWGRYIPALLSLLLAIFYAIKAYVAKIFWVETECLCGLFLSIVSLIAIFITNYIIKQKNTKII